MSQLENWREYKDKQSYLLSQMQADELNWAEIKTTFADLSAADQALPQQPAAAENAGEVKQIRRLIARHADNRQLKTF